MSHFFLQSLWSTLVLWGVLYISDYALTVTCARLYRGGVNRNIVFEGSFELNPVFQKDMVGVELDLSQVVTTSVLRIYPGDHGSGGSDDSPPSFEEPVHVSRH